MAKDTDHQLYSSRLLQGTDIGSRGMYRDALLMLRPPQELGREALSCAQSGRGHPARSDKAAHMHGVIKIRSEQAP